MMQLSGFTWKVIRSQRAQLEFEEGTCARLPTELQDFQFLNNFWEVIKNGFSREPCGQGICRQTALVAKRRENENTSSNEDKKFFFFSETLNMRKATLCSCSHFIFQSAKRLT